VRDEFARLFEYKAVFLVHEALSVLITPFILWFVMPTYAPHIATFFRDFTVHKDGVGHVCSFAMFDFRRHGDAKVYTMCFCLRAILICSHT
jgi:autophagy-related protein 9